MLKSALTSVTFRKLAARDVVDLTIRASLDAIEWGGDIHAPHGDTGSAKAIRALTARAGLSTCAYGSYFRAGTADGVKAAFAPVLESALALEAPVIRVWAGNRASALYDAAGKARLFDALASACAMAAREGVRVATEYHANTYTDTLETCLEMLRAIPALDTFWQPPVGLSHAENLCALAELAGRVRSLHVFEWRADGQRRPLAEGEARWRAVLRAAAAWPDVHHATLEFVADDDPRRLLEDAGTLRGWLKDVAVG